MSVCLRRAKNPNSTPASRPCRVAGLNVGDVPLQRWPGCRHETLKLSACVSPVPSLSLNFWECSRVVRLQMLNETVQRVTGRSSRTMNTTVVSVIFVTFCCCWGFFPKCIFQGWLLRCVAPPPPPCVGEVVVHVTPR